MKVTALTFNQFQENTYIISDNSSECIIIDPGCYEESEKSELYKFIESNNLKPVKLINTHCHIDHILGNKFASKKWNLDLLAHKKELPLLEKSCSIAKMYGFHKYEKSPYPKSFLKEGDEITFGQSCLKILFTPGHSPGHICLYSKENNLIISGDVIFQRSIGRTDLPGGDHNTLINSIITKLFLLPNSTQVFCGHGSPTNLGYEKEYNPFLQ